MADSTSKHPTEDTTVHKLCNEVGLLVAFETIGTLFQCAHLEQEAVCGEEALSSLLQWEVVGYGIPAIMANKNGVALCLADVDSGSKLCSFTISVMSHYTVIEDDFHIFTKPSGCYGIAFSNSIVAGKIFAILKHTVACTCLADIEEDAEEEEGIEPRPKRKRTNESDEDMGEDQVDANFKKPNKNLLSISEPKDFHHLSHADKDTSILQLTQVLSWTETLKHKEHIVSQVISIPSCTNKFNAELSSSFEEGKIPSLPTAAPPPPPPPPPAVIPPPPKLELKKKKDMSFSSNGKDLATSLADEIKRGVVLRPVSDDQTSRGSKSSGRSLSNLQGELMNGVVLKSVMNNHTMTLPMPPRTRKSDKLLFEIRTFRRKKLRNISTTEFPSSHAPFDDDSLEVILKRGLSTMFKKISGSTENLNMGSVDSKGEDTFNGLFSEP